VLLILLAAPLCGQDRQGWHGEEMPPGLERGEIEGEYLWPRDGSIMVYVPPGEFQLGSEAGDADERPVRQIELDGFYIDKYEVSWGQWKAAGMAYSRRSGMRRPRPEPPDWGIVDGHPMLDVTWPEARRYLEKVGKRLPSEAEWEKAARGTDGRTYPWGEQPPTPERAVWKDAPIAKESTAPVDCCLAGASPYGALNMSGNVYEWCEDTYAKDFYSRAPRRNPVNREQGRYRVLRGGAFVLPADDLRAALRYRLLPEDRAPYIGFRGALSGSPPGDGDE